MCDLNALMPRIDDAYETVHGNVFSEDDEHIINISVNQRVLYLNVLITASSKSEGIMCALCTYDCQDTMMNIS